jgi:hypothetical protein
MSNSVLAAELEGSNDFQQVLISAVLDKASTVLSTPPSGSRADAARLALANQVVADKLAVLAKFGRIVALECVQEDGTFNEAAVVSVVNNSFDKVAGVQAQEGALALSNLAQSAEFQQRVYMIGATLANDILKSAPPAADASAAEKAVDAVKRVFAIRYQAGRFIVGPNQFNYAVNVLAGLPEEVDAFSITDDQIRDRLTELTNLFAQTQVALTAAGVTTGLLN